MKKIQLVLVLRFLRECVCSVWVFITHGFQLMLVKVQRVISPPALNQRQLVGI